MPLWLDLNFNANSIAEFAFMLVAIFAVVSTLILFFHWQKYGMGSKGIWFAEISYVFVSLILLVTAFYSMN